MENHPRFVDVVDEVNIRDFISMKTQSGVGREGIDDSFFICDLGEVAIKHQRWLEALPRIVPYFATKCLPYEPLLICMKGMGTGFDCASRAEISQLLRLGAHPQDIVFANTCKQMSHILYAKEQGIETTVFDNEEELMKIKNAFPEAKLLLRIKTEKSISLFSMTDKFGATETESRSLLQKAIEMNLKVVGISFHVGTGCSDSSIFVESLKMTRQLFDYAKHIGYNFTVLDIGGGFPGTDGVPVTFEEISTVINNALDNYFPPHLYKNLKIIAEPGRYYAATALTLVTNVTGKRTRTCSTGLQNEKIFEYYINEGLHGALGYVPIRFGNEMKLSALKTANESEVYRPSLIFGGTCDGSDLVEEKCSLPELQIGEWIIWENTGAYSYSLAREFNGFKTRAFYNVMSRENLNLLKSLCVKGEIKSLRFIGAKIEEE